MFIFLNVYLPGNLGQMSAHSSMACTDAPMLRAGKFSVLHIQKRRKASRAICTQADMSHHDDVYAVLAVTKAKSE
jgi:hypothetical protein